MSKAHRDYFDELASVWHERMCDDPRFSELLKRFGVKHGDYVLDVGAGTGRMTTHLSELVGPEGLVTAQDFARQMLSEGMSLFHPPNVFWMCDDVHALALKPETYDKALCFSVFPHLEAPKQALSEIHRVLKPGGEMLVLHTQGSAEMNAFHASLDGLVKHDRLPPAATLASWMRETGFRIVRIEEKSDLYWVQGVRRSGN